MTSKNRKLARIFALMLTALLAFPSLYVFNRTTAATPPLVTEQNSRADGPAKVKAPSTAFSTGGSAPANDDCANAIDVTACPFTETRSTSGATVEKDEPENDCTEEQGQSTVWYNFTNAGATCVQVFVDTCGSNYDTTLAVYRPDGAECEFANFTQLTCNDDTDGCGDGLQSQSSFIADPGVTYKIVVGGFDGETGNLVINIDCETPDCPPIVINGKLGSGSASPPAQVVAQASGTQTTRLIRNGSQPSTCDFTKECDITMAGTINFDSYSIINQSDAPQCVSVELVALGLTGCNLQVNAYLTSYNPNSICTNYLADPDFSTGIPPDPLDISFVVPAGATLVLVVHDIFSSLGCDYTLKVVGNLCGVGFDFCLQHDSSAARFIQFNSTTGAYRFTDCARGVVLNGQGQVTTKGNSITLKHWTNDRRVSAQVDTAFNRGSGSVQIFSLGTTFQIVDRKTTDNSCACLKK